MHTHIVDYGSLKDNDVRKCNVQNSIRTPDTFRRETLLKELGIKGTRKSNITF